MTIKSCFWPLIGDKIFGWVGDAIDTVSIFTTLFGVCTSLGLGAIQLNKGINIFDPTGVPIGVAAQVCLIAKLINLDSERSGLGSDDPRIGMIRQLTTKSRLTPRNSEGQKNPVYYSSMSIGHFVS